MLTDNLMLSREMGAFKESREAENADWLNEGSTGRERNRSREGAAAGITVCGNTGWEGTG